MQNPIIVPTVEKAHLLPRSRVAAEAVGPAMRGRAGSLNSAVYERLRAMIFANQLRPAQKLAVQHLADELSVSRTPVSQALERLYQEGYVIQVPDRGYFVAEINSREAHDLYHMRVALETYSLQVAMATGIESADSSRLRELQEAYRDRIEDNSVLERVLADQDFHLYLAGLSHNDYLVNTLQGIFERLNLKRRVEGYWPGLGNRGNVGLSEHEGILAAMAGGEIEHAQQLLKDHIWEAWVQFEAHLLKISVQ